MLGNGCTVEVATTAESRSYLQIWNAGTCAREIRFYGCGCQMMEVKQLQRDIRGALTPRYTWNRYGRELCQIGGVRQPPSKGRAVLRFLEQCSVGIPYPLLMADDTCHGRAVINHGQCNDGIVGVLEAWSGYVEVIDFTVRRMESETRASASGVEAVRVIELLVDTERVFYQSAMSFSALAFARECGSAGSPTDGGSAQACDITFGVKRGCGSSRCGCVDACDDGTQTVYVPYICEAAGENRLWFSVGGGAGSSAGVTGSVLMPRPVPLEPVLSPCPKVVATSSNLYILGGGSPVELYEVPLDDAGMPIEAEAVRLAVLGAEGDGGEPSALAVSGGTVYALVKLATGSALYVHGGSGDAAAGPVHTFNELNDHDHMAVCGNEIVVGGDGTHATFDVDHLARSIDGGKTFTRIESPAPGVAVAGIEKVGDRLWVSFADGSLFWLGGNSWHAVSMGATSGGTGSGEMAFANPAVGWVGGGDGTAPMSTWLGGDVGGLWTNRAPRISSWPKGATVQALAVPTAAAETLAANTLAVLATDASGAQTVLVGRAAVAGLCA